jgi:hypothetical protein
MKQLFANLLYESRKNQRQNARRRAAALVQSKKGPVSSGKLSLLVSSKKEPVSSGAIRNSGDDMQEDGGTPPAVYYKLDEGR